MTNVVGTSRSPPCRRRAMCEREVGGASSALPVCQAVMSEVLDPSAQDLANLSS